MLGFSGELTVWAEKQTRLLQSLNSIQCLVRAKAHDALLQKGHKFFKATQIIGIYNVGSSLIVLDKEVN